MLDFIFNFININRMKKLLIFVIASTSALSLLQARIGESKNTMEGRMLSKGAGAIEYAQKELKEREMLELPYKNLFLLMPKNAQHGFYYKRPDGRPTTPQDIAKQDDMHVWETHACYNNGSSVMEFYRRRGEHITLEEVAALLKLMDPENKKWEKHYDIDSIPIFSTAGNDIYFSEYFREQFAEKPLLASEKPKNDEPEIWKTSKYADIYKLIPKTRTRYILMNDPSTQSYATQTLQDKILYEESKKAFDAYMVKYPADKTAVKKKEDAEKKKREEDNKKERGSGTYINTSSSSKQSLPYGNIPRPIIDKVARLYMHIPTEPDTALGYHLKLSDDSIRVKFYSDAILFIDSKFDKEIRAKMEEMFTEQAKTREDEAQKSISYF